MAYVNMRSVEYDIRRNIGAKFAARRTPHEEAIAKMGDHIYNCLMDNRLSLVNDLAKIPDGFLVRVSQLVVKEGGTEYRINLSRLSYGDVAWANSHLAGVQIPQATKVYEEFKKHHDARQAIIVEERELMASLKPVMGNCTSLNQLVKVWPSALDYISKRHREKFHEKRGKNTHVPKPLDDTAKVLLTKTAMLG